MNATSMDDVLKLHKKMSEWLEEHEPSDEGYKTAMESLEKLSKIIEESEKNADYQDEVAEKMKLEKEKYYHQLNQDAIDNQHKRKTYITNAIFKGVEIAVPAALSVATVNLEYDGKCFISTKSGQRLLGDSCRIPKKTNI